MVPFVLGGVAGSAGAWWPLVGAAWVRPLEGAGLRRVLESLEPSRPLVELPLVE